MDNLSGRLISKVDQQKALLSTDNKARIYSIEVYIVLQEPKHVTNRFISKRQNRLKYKFMKCTCAKSYCIGSKMFEVYVAWCFIDRKNTWIQLLQIILLVNNMVNMAQSSKVITERINNKIKTGQTKFHIYQKKN